MRLFAFSVAAKLKMTVRELCSRMDSAEIMEWAAFLMLEDDKEKQRIENEMIEESSEEAKQERMRQFFKKFSKPNKVN